MKRVFSYLALLSVSFILFSCNNIAKKTVAKNLRKTGREAVENVSAEGSSKAGRKATKRLARESLENTSDAAISRTLRELASSDESFHLLYDQFSSRIGRDFADGVVVSSTDKGVLMASREFPNTSIRMNKNMLVGNAGSLKNSGPMNEFLNDLLPDKTYLIDDVFTYNTDDLGRVMYCTADRTKAFKTIERNTQRNTDIQKHIIDHLDGRPGLDDGGHLFANSTGGPNELINQVPMARNLNQTGKWRELERIEEQALREGKQVNSARRLLYKGNEKRPYAIEFISVIDGKETKTIVENI